MAGALGLYADQAYLLAFILFTSHPQRKRSRFTSVRTYYDPPLVNDNGHLLYLRVKKEKFLLETDFVINQDQKFDHVRVKTMSVKTISEKTVVLSWSGLQAV